MWEKCKDRRSESMGESGPVICVSHARVSLPLVGLRVEGGRTSEVQVMEGISFYSSYMVPKLHTNSVALPSSTTSRHLFLTWTSMKIGLFSDF